MTTIGSLHFMGKASSWAVWSWAENPLWTTRLRPGLGTKEGPARLKQEPSTYVWGSHHILADSDSDEDVQLDPALPSPGGGPPHWRPGRNCWPIPSETCPRHRCAARLLSDSAAVVCGESRSVLGSAAAATTTTHSL